MAATLRIIKNQLVNCYSYIYVYIKINYKALVATSVNLLYTLGVLEAIWVTIVKIQELTKIFEELESSLCKQRLFPSWVRVGGWSTLEFERALQALCWLKQSLENDASRPSALAAFKHKPLDVNMRMGHYHHHDSNDLKLWSNCSKIFLYCRLMLGHIDHFVDDT